MEVGKESRFRHKPLRTVIITAVKQRNGALHVCGGKRGGFSNRYGVCSAPGNGVDTLRLVGTRAENNQLTDFLGNLTGNLINEPGLESVNRHFFNGL